MQPRHPQRVLRVGLLGCGRVARTVHLPNLGRLRGVEVAALAESDPGHLAEAARLAPRAAVFADPFELLALRDLDAVMICLPPALHARAAVTAFRTGKHVYLEKPLATDLDEARAVIDAWRESGLTGAIGFNYRFNPLYARARELVASGRLGPIVAARNVFTTAGGGAAMPAWKRARASGGGALLDLASHEIDLLTFVLGQDVAGVSAQVCGVETEDDSASLSLAMSGGAQAQVLVSLASVPDASMAVAGRAGRLWVDRYRSLRPRLGGPAAGGRLGVFRRVLTAPAGLPHWLRKMRSPAREPSYLPALAGFIDGVRTGAQDRPDLLDGYRSLAVVVAAEESERTGRSTTPEPLRGTRFNGSRPPRATREEVHA